MERHMEKVAVYFILIKDDEVLLLKRSNTGWQDGNYGLPAGHLEKDETILSGILREVKEEIGLDLKEDDIRFVHVMHRVSSHMDVFFEATFNGDEPVNNEPEKCEHIRWFKTGELPENMVPSVRFAINNYINSVSFSEFVQEE